jgi:hypothetical protein
MANTNPIKFAVTALIIFILLAIVAGFVIPFNVELSATVQAFSGDVTVLIGNEAPDPLSPDRQTTIEPGQTIRLQPDSEAIVTFTIDKGRAHLTGPATLSLVESYRRATSLGHLLDSFSREYVLTIEQTQGTVRYNFANTSPELDEIQLTIQLPDSNYRPAPSDPCWTIIVSTAGQSTVNTTPCP